MKKWIKTNFYKITSILALLLATTGLIIGSVAHHKTNELSYYLDYEGNAHWGGATIWEYKVSDKHKISLYFGFKPTSKNDIKWDSNYPNGYFDN